MFCGVAGSSVYPGGQVCQKSSVSWSLLSLLISTSVWGLEWGGPDPNWRVPGHLRTGSTRRTSLSLPQASTHPNFYPRLSADGTPFSGTWDWELCLPFSLSSVPNNKTSFQSATCVVCEFQSSNSWDKIWSHWLKGSFVWLGASGTVNPEEKPTQGRETGSVEYKDLLLPTSILLFPVRWQLVFLCYVHFPHFFSPPECLLSRDLSLNLLIFFSFFANRRTSSLCHRFELFLLVGSSCYLGLLCLDFAYVSSYLQIKKCIWQFAYIMYVHFVYLVSSEARSH